jgi:electron transport complex protein RnfA
MGVAVTFVMTISTIITFLLINLVLEPTNTTYLKTIMFILVIASMVQLLDILLKRYLPRVKEAFGIYLPLITTNCAVLGTTLLVVNIEYTFIEALVFSLGSGIGFTLVIYIFATIREKLEISNIPRSFKGVPIAFITAAIMAILLGRFVI